MKVTKKSTNGTSFHDSTFRATLTQVKTVCGETYCNGDTDDKVQYEWEMETADGTPFTIYDWKEYRRFGSDEMIEWHIGGFNGADTYKAQQEIEEALSNI